MRQRIHREGPIPFDAFVDEALYGDGGFFTGAHGAGRAGRDFVTSPEVGPLFGAMVGRALDRCWDELDARDPFVVVEAGAGRGRLAADVLASEPRCSPALRYVLVERSDARRAEQRDLLALEPVEDALGPLVHDDADTDAVVAGGLGPIATSLAELPAIPRRAEWSSPTSCSTTSRSGSWSARPTAGRRCGSVSSGDGFEEDLVRAAPELAVEADHVAARRGAGRRPVAGPDRRREWLQSCAFVLRRGVLIVVDYAATAAELVERGEHGWLRTYRQPRARRVAARGARRAGHHRRRSARVPGPRRGPRRTRARARVQQAEWLRDLGIDDLVADARAQWDARAHVGDLEALRHRSRVTEAAALVDPTGLGAHRVLVFRAR